LAVRLNETQRKGLHTIATTATNGIDPKVTHRDEFSGCGNAQAMRKSWMLTQVIARLRKIFRKARRSHGLHAPFHVTTHRGHTVQMFQSLELAIETAESLGPDHYVVDRHGLQNWSPQRKLLRNEE
jgi:hypothetical protein